MYDERLPWGAENRAQDSPGDEDGPEELALGQRRPGGCGALEPERSLFFSVSYLSGLGACTGKSEHSIWEMTIMD